MRLATLTLALVLAIPSLGAAQDAGGQPVAASLDELGFTKDQTQGSRQDQVLLDKRSRMLKIHQELGLINIAPMLGTLFTAPGDGAHQGARNLHAALGVTAVGLFAATAYFAIKAPKPKSTVDKGSVRWHKKLALASGIGLIITPILGAMAYEQTSKGQKVHGAASLHGAAAAITAACYGGAMVAVSIKF